MSQIKKIHHIAVAVSDIEDSLRFWSEAMGLELSHVEEVPSQKAVVAFLPVGDSEIELVKPTASDTGVAKFLSERGPGIHHICIEVDNIAEMLEGLKCKNIRLINETPVDLGDRKIAFIHPKSAGGVLVELYQLSD